MEDRFPYKQIVVGWNPVGRRIEKADFFHVISRDLRKQNLVRRVGPRTQNLVETF